MARSIFAWGKSFSPEPVPIFSIVNSLTDACNVRGVQISVDGKTAVNFRESMKLDQIYHADYRLAEEN